MPLPCPSHVSLTCVFICCPLPHAEQAKVTVLSLDEAVFLPAEAATAEPTPSSNSSSGGDANVMHLQLGAVAATADADALLCLAAAADSAAQQLSAALAAAAANGTGVAQTPPKPRRPKAPKQPRALAITVRQLRLEQPMSAERDMAVEVTAVHAVVGAQHGSRHSVHTDSAVLTMLGRPVLRWRQLAATLRLHDGSGGSGTDSGRLPVQPLPLPWPAASAVAEGVQQAAPPAEARTEATGSRSFDAYHRARLGAWLDADAATSPAAASPVDAAAAAALGAGPVSILDANVRCVSGWCRTAAFPGHTLSRRVLAAGLCRATKSAAAIRFCPPPCQHLLQRCGADCTSRRRARAHPAVQRAVLQGARNSKLQRLSGLHL